MKKIVINSRRDIESMSDVFGTIRRCRKSEVAVRDEMSAPETFKAWDGNEFSAKPETHYVARVVENLGQPIPAEKQDRRPVAKNKWDSNWVPAPGRPGFYVGTERNIVRVPAGYEVTVVTAEDDKDNPGEKAKQVLTDGFIACGGSGEVYSNNNDFVYNLVETDGLGALLTDEERLAVEELRRQKAKK